MWPVLTRFYAEAAQWPRTLLDSFCCAIIIIIIFFWPTSTKPEGTETL